MENNFGSSEQDQPVFDNDQLNMDSRYRRLDDPQFKNEHNKWTDLRNRFLIAFATIMAWNLTWWIYPFIYGKHLGDATSPAGLWLFALYTTAVGAALYLIFLQQFKSWWSFLPIVAAYTLSFTGIIKGNLEVFILLLLFNTFLLALQFPFLKIQNGFGLATFSLMAGTIPPITLFYIQNHYVTSDFLNTLMTMVLSFGFFMTPIFITNNNRKQVISLAIGLLLIFNIATLPWNFWTIIAIALILMTWVFFINQRSIREPYRLLVFSVIQLIMALIVFLQQIR